MRSVPYVVAKGRKGENGRTRERMEVGERKAKGSYEEPERRRGQKEVEKGEKIRESLRDEERREN